MPAKTQPMSRGFFIFNVIMTALFFPALILLLAGDWQWVEGWLFALWFVVMILANLIYLYLKNPAPAGRKDQAARQRQPESLGQGSDHRHFYPGVCLADSHAAGCGALQLVAGLPALVEDHRRPVIIARPVLPLSADGG